MSEPVPRPSPAPAPERRLQGPVVVVTFVVLLLVVVAVAVAFRFANRERINAAQLKTMPTLAANVTVRCREPAMGTSELKVRGRCTDAGVLELTSEPFAEGTKEVAFVVLGTTRAKVGLLHPGTTVEVPLAGEEAGPHLVSVLLADGDVKPAELQAALDAKPADDVRTRLVLVEAHVSKLIAAGLNARAERLGFQVEDARLIH
jgi:hypothetical protein